MYFRSRKYKQHYRSGQNPHTERNMFISNRKLESLRNRMADTLVEMGYREEDYTYWDKYRVSKRVNINKRYYGPQILSLLYENSLKEINTGEAYYALEAWMFNIVHLPHDVKKEQENANPNITVGEARDLFYEYLLCGIEFDYHTGREGSYGLINIVDWKNIQKNEFTFFRKWQGVRNDGFGWDFIVMLNRMPVVAVCLQPTTEGNRPCEDAYRVMREQIDASVEMQIYTQIVILSDGKKTLVGTATDTFEMFKTWNSLDGEETEREDVMMPIRSMLRPDRLCNIIYNFIRVLPISERDTITMLSDMHLFFAMDKAYQKINADTNPEIGHVNLLKAEDELTVSTMGGQMETAAQLLYDRCSLSEMGDDYRIVVLNSHPTAKNFDKWNAIEEPLLIIATNEVTPAECSLIINKCTHARVIHICQREMRPLLYAPFGEEIYAPTQLLKR